MIDFSQTRLYLVARAQLSAGPLAELVPQLVAAGVDLLQLREKEMEAGDLIRVGESVAAACRDAGLRLIVNDRPDVAVALGADGVHLGQNDLPLPIGRRIVGEDAIVGLSTHSRAEIDAAAATERLDYVAVGPVFETPTKEGRPSVGTGLLAYASSHLGMPWFAIGGIDGDTLGDVMAAGARRIVVVRAITEAADPVVAAQSLRRGLESVPL